MEKKALLGLLDEILELLELHQRNHLNVCLCGGMETIIDVLFNSKEEDARREACGILSFCVSNNPDVQDIVIRLGAMNLTH